MQRFRMQLLAIAVVTLAALLSVSHAHAQDKTKASVYGFVMTDVRYDKLAIDPDWFDVMRPTKLPSFEDQFGEAGSMAFSVRQTRFGIKAWIPTDLGELRTTFEWELFGTGVDAGQTTLRLRHAYGELGQFGAGQYWSPFMDIDVFPNSIEYWGPNGMAFFRNVQLRWMPIQGDSRLTFALERPGASADQGAYSDRIELAGVQPRFPLPDFSAEYRLGQSWGYIEGAGIVRYIEWDDLGPGPTDLSGDALGWGLNLSSNVKFGRDVLRLAATYGEAVQNYMNDAPADVGVVPDPGDPVAPLKGEAIPMFGMSAFLDHTWSDKFTSSIGYSRMDIDNVEGQSSDAFKVGQYALANVLYTPVPNLMLGPELQWDHRENNSDGWKIDNYAVQFSAKYSFSSMFGE
jgi:hypothetical protein